MNFYTIQDIANMLQLKETTIRKMARNGILPGMKMNDKEWRFTDEDLSQFCDNMRNKNDK